MASVAESGFARLHKLDNLSGTERAQPIDRWIFVGMAVWFILIVLVGFVPDSMMKVAIVKAGMRPPFPTILHVHAVLMGSFLLLLLAQTLMVATGRCALHKQVGIAAFILVPALVVAGLILAPTMFHQAWGGAHFGPPAVRMALAPIVPILENILLLQISAGVLFAVFIGIALNARATAPGVHKRMMFLATAVPLGAAIDRMEWLPSSMPASPWATDLYILLAVSPMFVWDLVRNRRVHEAYTVWLAIYLPVAALVAFAWDKPWWHAAAERMMGV
ncbi:MAG: hypothetical protein J0J06_14185 [Sphingomonas sp.]|uniref:hypothetical protein n=1 Tax=Sphingomonas sp. TaxID=28214 RepID=UPI001AD04567|nr:hypothetical protein [Sphingomonas sp.]MBN8816581.1 hypothetical protein [Sphingomonas sp.]